jgi:hypothetical protein
MNSREVAEGRQSIVQVDRALKQVTLCPAKPGEVAKSFTFDAVFDAETSQSQVYDGVAKKLVESVMQGYNGGWGGADSCPRPRELPGRRPGPRRNPEPPALLPAGTIFCYGQTGTGKTHTMEGSGTDAGKGITPRTFEQIFSSIEWSENLQFLVRASFLEVYNEEIRDLLSKVRRSRRRVAVATRSF